MRFTGLKYPRALRSDTVSAIVHDAKCAIQAFDGAQDCSTWALLSLPTARKLALAILKAVDAAEGRP